MINLLTAFTLALGSGVISPTIVTVPLVATPTVAPVSSANDVVDRVQVFYANIKQVTAQFRQAVTNVTYGSTKTSDGTMWVKKPGNMRWDYLEKKVDRRRGQEELHLERDELYVVGKARQQAGDQEELEAGPDAGRGQLPLRQGRSARRVQRGSTPLASTATRTTSSPSSHPSRRPAQYKTLVLVVNHDDFHVSQSIIIDSLGKHQPLPLLHARLREGDQGRLFPVR